VEIEWGEYSGKQKGVRKEETCGKSKTFEQEIYSLKAE
jgi:hypothetical protein